MPGRARGQIAGEFEFRVWGDDEKELTGFITQFTEKRYSQDYDPFFGEGYRVPAEIENKQYIFSVLEVGLAGNFHYYGLRSQFIKDANAAIIVFSINRAGSFDGAKELASQLKRARLEAGMDPLPIALVANRTIPGKDRVVTEDEVQALLQSGDCDIVLECFASQDDPSGITKLFFDLANLILAQESETQAKQEEERAKQGDKLKRSDFGLEEEWSDVGRRKRLVRKIKGIFGS